MSKNPQLHLRLSWLQVLSGGGVREAEDKRQNESVLSGRMAWILSSSVEVENDQPSAVHYKGRFNYFQSPLPLGRHLVFILRLSGAVSDKQRQVSLQQNQDTSC